jgi:Uma2 family endonuclease
MSEPAQRRWTVEEFFAWQKDQPLRYELVGGFPVRLMAGATNVHDDIVVNLIAEVRQQLRGGGCRPFTGDGSIETRPGQIRRPDAGIDCGRRDPTATMAAEPRMVAEILSPSTRDFETFEKLEEYKAVASLDYLLVIEPNAPEVVMWSRAADRTWERRLGPRPRAGHAGRGSEARHVGALRRHRVPAPAKARSGRARAESIAVQRTPKTSRRHLALLAREVWPGCPGRQRR